VEVNRYPIGPMELPTEPEGPQVREWIQDIDRLPAQLRDATQGLDDSQLDTPYREGGWTVRQVVHHLVDSHLNAILRFHRGLTESNPTIHVYDQEAWAALPDRGAPIEPSLALVEALHRRWVVLLHCLGAEQFSRTFLHPEIGPVRLDQCAAMYSWHGRHHVTHITRLRERKGWIR